MPPADDPLERTRPGLPGTGTTSALSAIPLDGSTVVFPGTGAGPENSEERAHYLVVVSGDTPGRRIALQGSMVIGRAEPADVVLADARVSRSHCRIAVQGSHVAVTDLDSTNGTFVDGRRVATQARLAPGGRLRVGDCILEHQWRARREVEASEELDRDLESAGRYVLSLLPAPLDQGAVRTDWVLLPSARLGGDAFGYRWLDERHFMVYLVDVSGHGVGAAMHAVSVMNVLRQDALPAADLREPAAVAASLNDMFQMDSHGGMYVSLWYGIYDLVERRLRYCSAGHHPAFLVPPESMPLHTRNVVLGAAPGFRFREADAVVPSGSRLHVFSDGVFEITTRAGRQWGLEDVRPLLLARGISSGQDSRRLLDAVRAESVTPDLEDDFSLVIVTFE
jgi:hypothetical protein